MGTEVKPYCTRVNNQAPQRNMAGARDACYQETVYFVDPDMQRADVSNAGKGQISPKVQQLTDSMG